MSGALFLTGALLLIPAGGLFAASMVVYNIPVNPEASTYNRRAQGWTPLALRLAFFSAGVLAVTVILWIAATWVGVTSG